LISVGVGYLTLSRSSETLSGGEAQRIRLGAQFDNFLSGVLYVMDEPTISLHSDDTMKLIKSFKKLKSEGNTLLIVEHDKAVLEASDYIIDMGPGAGNQGGEIIAQGTPEQIIANNYSVTGRYLSGKDNVLIGKVKRKPAGFIKLVGASLNNLKNINVNFPLGVFSTVTGVSGCGKSTLVFDILANAVSGKLNGKSNVLMEGAKGVGGIENVDKLIKIDQSPIGRTPRSNLATYTGLFTPIRELFASTNDAVLRGYNASRFSFNLKGGRCETCHGDGFIKVEMYFMPDAYVKCEECSGKRYNNETLEIRYKDKNIAQILEMSVDDACDFFSGSEEIKIKLDVLKRVGLGYLPLGQSATTLSGGEAQRIKLSTELSRASTGRTLYILDEPTTGLHFEDVKKLLNILHELVDRGNSVLVIEHNIDVIKNSDWVIDMGPGGGSDGGEIIAEGSPEDIKKSDRSLTGKYM
jgi:excinuclease ABC subunit A